MESSIIDKLNEAKEILSSRLGKSDYAIITGTGININLSQEPLDSLPYSEIPHMPQPTSPSHRGHFERFEVDGKNIIVANGRFHYYEGYSSEEVVFLARLLALGTPKLVILTNAAGGLNPLFNKGDLMVVRDHINLMGRNPLVGKNIDQLGERFPDMSKPYSETHIEQLKKVAAENGITLREGIYVSVLGPSLETPAETRFLRMIGSDAVGMSTVPEVIALNHASVPCIAISIITNMNRPDCMKKIPIEKVIETASASSKTLSLLLKKFLEVI